MSWQKILQQGFSNAVDLLEFLELDPTLFSTQAEILFKTKVTRGFAARIQKRTPLDPLLLQILAQNAEFKTHENYIEDPLQEKQFNPLPGLIHKYHNRVLLTLTGTCAINCRYCFRRHFPYQQNLIKSENTQDIIEYINSRPQIQEVIFSGGDPLLTSDDRLENWIQNLSKIKHLQTIRIHTRIPIVLPERITKKWLRIWQQTPLKKIIVIHSNHANEIDDTVEQVLAALREHKFTLLNQAVLLKNINDNALTLKNLHDRLWQCGVLPYYLHYPDPVAGTHHFYISKQQALEIYAELQQISSGYLVPKLAQELPGQPNKTLLSTK